MTRTEPLSLQEEIDLFSSTLEKLSLSLSKHPPSLEQQVNTRRDKYSSLDPTYSFRFRPNRWSVAIRLIYWASIATSHWISTIHSTNMQKTILRRFKIFSDLSNFHPDSSSWYRYQCGREMLV